MIDYANIKLTVVRCTFDIHDVSGVDLSPVFRRFNFIWSLATITLGHKLWKPNIHSISSTDEAISITATQRSEPCSESSYCRINPAYYLWKTDEAYSYLETPIE
jgi:hypothetical protein